MDGWLGSLQEFLVENCAIVVPVLYIVGIVLKNTPKIKDWLIPYILGVLGMVICTIITVTGQGAVITGILQGIVTAGLSVYAHQLIKQGIRRA